MKGNGREWKGQHDTQTPPTMEGRKDMKEMIKEGNEKKWNARWKEGRT